MDMNPIELEPEASWNVETDTFFVLFTRRNPTAGQRITSTAASINASQWNNNAPGTRFIIHGWTQSATSGMNAEIRNAFLASADHNVVGLCKNTSAIESASLISSPLQLSIGQLELVPSTTSPQEIALAPLEE